jgi:hypothetical protein
VTTAIVLIEAERDVMSTLGGSLAALIWVLAGGPGDGRTHVVVREPMTFNLFHSGGLDQPAPRAGEVLRLQTPPGASTPQSFVVRPLRLDAYRGDVNAHLALLAASMIDQMRRTIPGFVWRGDGRVAVNRQPGHQISFQARIGGRTTYGRRVLLVVGPDPPPRTGVDIMMLAARSPAIPSIDAVGANGQLKSPYRTFRFGTRTSN